MPFEGTDQRKKTHGSKSLLFAQCRNRLPAIRAKSHSKRNFNETGQNLYRNRDKNRIHRMDHGQNVHVKILIQNQVLSTSASTKWPMPSENRNYVRSAKNFISQNVFINKFQKVKTPSKSPAYYVSSLIRTLSRRFCGKIDFPKLIDKDNVSDKTW